METQPWVLLGPKLFQIIWKRLSGFKILVAHISSTMICFIPYVVLFIICMTLTIYISFILRDTRFTFMCFKKYSTFKDLFQVRSIKLWMIQSLTILEVQIRSILFLLCIATPKIKIKTKTHMRKFWMRRIPCVKVSYFFIIFYIE